MIRLILALLVLVYFASGADARPRPVRNWIAQHRPGIVIPKSSAAPCASCATGCPAACASGQCANGTCAVPTAPKTPLVNPIIPLKK